MNVKNAFLNAELDETIFTVFPESFDVGSGDIFAAMQVTIWIKTITALVVSILDEKLKSFGFKPSGADKKSISQKRLHTALVR
jgi:hypothetical protein